LTATISLLGTFGTLSIIALFYILAKLSERFGSVVKMPPRYRYYYIGIAVLAIGYLTHLVVANAILTLEKTPAWLISPGFLLATYHLPLAIGLTIGLVITWRYWSWLITEKNG
jgi:hypothetical protein